MFHGFVEYPRGNNCLAGMGQGPVLATPLEIATEAATIARGESGSALDCCRLTRRRLWTACILRPDATDAIDLHLNAEAFRQRTSAW